MLTEDYCDFETAKLLKEKGFKQDCDYATSWYAAEYYKNSAQGEWFEGEHEIIKDIDDKCTISYLSDKGIFIPAPTHQMALKWLREVHDIFIQIELYSKHNDYCFELFQNTHRLMVEKREVYNSFEKAVDAALKYSLTNLI